MAATSDVDPNESATTKQVVPGGQTQQSAARKMAPEFAGDELMAQLVDLLTRHNELLGKQVESISPAAIGAEAQRAIDAVNDIVAGLTFKPREGGSEPK